MAFLHGHGALARQLFTRMGATPLWLACLFDDLPAVRRLAAASPGDLTVRYCACQCDIIHRLLSCQVHVDDDKDVTWAAALSGHIDVLLFLHHECGLPPLPSLAPLLIAVHAVRSGSG